MGRALIFLVAAVAVILIPYGGRYRYVAAAVLTVAAAYFGLFFEIADVERRAELTARQSAELENWSAPEPGLVRITGWQTVPPLRFDDRWTVDVPFRFVSARDRTPTGVEITATAYDCPAVASALDACSELGRSSASTTFLPVKAGMERSLRLRFVFAGRPPAATLRIQPEVTAVRR